MYPGNPTHSLTHSLLTHYSLTTHSLLAHYSLTTHSLLTHSFRGEIKKGMILLTDDITLKVSVRSFVAQIHVLHSPTTIKEGYQPFIHVDHVRQSVKLSNIRKIDRINEMNEVVYSTDADSVLRTGIVTHSLTHSLTHSVTQSLSHSLTHSPTHSLTQGTRRLFSWNL